MGKILEFKPKPKPESPKPIESLMNAIERDKHGRTPLEAALAEIQAKYTGQELTDMYNELEDEEDKNEEASSNQDSD